MFSIQLYRVNEPTIMVQVDESTVYMDECMGRFDIALITTSPIPLDIRIDDYLIWDGIRYTINVPFQLVRGASFDYNIVFEHPSRALNDIIFKQAGSIEFNYFGTPRQFIELVVVNMNVDDDGWFLGQYDDLDPKFADFVTSGSGYNCKVALSLIAELFELEYWFSGDGKTINLTKQAGHNTSIDFAYGQGKGLYSVERGMMDSSIPNRIYGFGGTQNLGTDYRNGFQKRLIFNPGYIQRALLPGEKRRETSVIFEDIFPERTGALTTVSNDGLSLTDTSIDFDLNGNAIPGETAKVVFKSGKLGGREFEISYNHTSKTFRITPTTESNGAIFPSSLFYPEIGDKYSFVGIYQPTSYVTNAEDRLKVATEDSFKQLTRPPYRVEIDEKYMRENGFSLKSGDRVRLRDTALEIDDLIRVTSVSFPLVNPQKCTVVISDKITYTQEVQFVIDQGKVKENVKVVDKRNAEEERNRAYRMRQLQGLVFDADGYFNGENIKPESIETLMLSVGAKSQNFYLDEIRITPNAGDDENTIEITPGKLIHREISIEGLGYIWEIGGFIQEGLSPEKSYYLSIKCSRSSLIGTWVLSEVPVKTEAESGYYHFNCGVLYAVLDGRRDYAFTNGMTFINGDSIRTGKISAERVDVDEIFAQEVSASNLTVTGNSMIGPFSIDSEGLYYATGGVVFQGRTRINRAGITWDSLEGLGKNVIFSIGSTNAILDIFKSGDHSKEIGLRIDMGNVNNTALQIVSGGLQIDDGEFRLTNGDFRILNGNIFAGTKQGISGTFQYTESGLAYYLQFEKGILVEQGLVT